MINESALVTREHLRAQLIPLIGREQEVLAVGELLLRPEVRLVTLTGIGGIGKTRLGLQVARSLEQEFADGVYFVPLSSLHDPDLVIPTLAQALGLKEAGDWSLEERLQTYLHEKRLLLLLDNFEQVAPAAFKLPLLVAACPQVKILITSRVVLHMRGEHEFPVLPLLLPDEQHPETVETLSHYSAIALFLQQARAVQPDFQLTVENARAITEICVRLDGLPLALELAAARVKLLPPRTLLARLKHRFEILISPSQDLPPRQRTLRNTLAWSYHLLTQEEQRLFRQLSVFTGNFTLEAAEALSNAAPSQELSVLDGLASLLDNSLLNQVERGAGEARFMMLETVREYGLECLEACGEIIATRRVHALYYVALAEQAEPYLSSGEQCIWLQQLEQAYPNLRMALAWFIEQAEAEMALRLSWALWRFWWVRGRVLEGRNWLEQALALSQEHENATLWIRARAVSALGILIGMQGHLDQAEDLCQESLALCRQREDTSAIIPALWMLGYIAREKSNYASAWALAQESLQLARKREHVPGITYSLETLAAVALDQGQYQKARTLIEESLTLSRQVGDIWETARSLWLLGVTQLFQGDIAQAQRRFEESLTCSREIHDQRGIAYSLVMSGYVAYFQRKPDRMRALMEEALVSYKEAGDRRGIAEVLYGLGWATLAQGDAPAAQALFEESLTILRLLDRKWFLALALDGLAAAVAIQEQTMRAARLWGAAEALREEIGATLSLFIQALYQPFMTTARARVSEEEFALEWEAGRMQVVQADPTEALFSIPEPARGAGKTVGPPVSPLGTRKNASRLTAREVEVLRWVTQGLTDIQIAEKLVISPRTVSTHLTSIYNKLGVSSRSAATRFAIEYHLV